MDDLPDLPDVTDDEASIPGEGGGRESAAREISMVPQVTQVEPLSKLEKEPSLPYRQAFRFGPPKLLGWPVGTLTGP